MNRELIDQLKDQSIEYLVDVELKYYTHTLTGGIVPLMVYPKNEKELVFVIQIFKASGDSFEILSGMTNIAVASGQLDFFVVNMSKYEMREPTLRGNVLDVSSSFDMKELTQWAFKHKVRGLEWMEGIPGTVGAGIYMNAGFLPQQEISNVLVTATYLDLDDFKVKRIKNHHLHFRYRYSEFQDMHVVVLSGTFLVRHISDVGIKNHLRMMKSKIIIRTLHERRVKNQPLDYPSAGTVFVPPIPFHVGGMLREMNLTGYRIGGAEISTKSPGFIIGVDHMTGEDYKAMVEFIEKSIAEKYDLDIEPEVRLIGFDD